MEPPFTTEESREDRRRRKAAERQRLYRERQNFKVLSVIY
jgi:hypothetical protein